MALATHQVVWPAYKKIRDWHKDRSVYTITVNGTDGIYLDLHEWVLTLLPAVDRRALVAESSCGVISGDIDSDFQQPKAMPSQMRLRYDGSRTQKIILNGFEVTVAIEHENIPDREKLPDQWQRFFEKIVFTVYSTEARDVVVERLEEVAQAKLLQPGPPPLKIPNRWGDGFSTRLDIPPRRLESVILKKGQLEYLVDDLQMFLDSEQQYGDFGRPYHRGYLFYGIPGTGKTTVARALADHFKLPIYYLPLADIKKDTDLMALMGAIRPRSILLLEDVDIFQATTQRTEEKGSVTLSAVLNALDGIWTPHGLITIMTTNDLTALDPALLRAGRIDIKEEFTALDEYQIGRFLEFFQVSRTSDFWHFLSHSPAELIETICAQKLMARKKA